MATVLPKYQSPKRKRSSSSATAKKPRDQEVTLSSDYNTPSNDGGSCIYSDDNQLIHIHQNNALPKLVSNEHSRSGETTFADHSSSEVNASSCLDNTPIISLTPSTSSSSLCIDKPKENRSAFTKLSPAAAEDLSVRKDILLLRSPSKVDRQFVPFKSLLSAERQMNLGNRLGCTCVNNRGECSSCKWRTMADDDGSDDENTNIQLHINFSDEDSEHELYKDESYSDQDSNLVSGPMSALNVSRRPRPTFAEEDVRCMKFPSTSPDFLSECLYKDSPISRYSSPDLGYSGTPVLELESSADLDEALNNSLDSAASSNCTDFINSTTTRQSSPDNSESVKSEWRNGNRFRRPVPSEAAFERKSFHSPALLTKNCPATPLRASHLFSSGHDDYGLHRTTDATQLARQNSLVTNKVLLSQTEIPEDADVSFHRDFEDEGVLGAGQFSTVYLGRAKDGSNRICAIKKLNNQFRSRKERDYHLNEVRIMERIGKVPCQYVIHFFTAWQEDGHLYVDIEFAANGTLKDLMNHMVSSERTFAESTIWCVLHDVSAGLKHIHSCGYVHLDIKPANILIGETGVLKIADFGCAVEIGVDSDGSEGDTRYMAAELLESNIKMPSADVFSLGVTAYESCMLLQITGLPLEGEEWHALRLEKANPIPGRSTALTSTINSMMLRNAVARMSVEHILAVPQAASANSASDLVLSTAKPNRRYYSHFSSSFRDVSSHHTYAKTDADRAVTPKEGVSMPYVFLLPPIKPDTVQNDHIENRTAFKKTESVARTTGL